MDCMLTEPLCELLNIGHLQPKYNRPTSDFLTNYRKQKLKYFDDYSTLNRTVDRLP